jgi:peptidoglycan/LPS O-acetylase OafA/YrhL
MTASPTVLVTPRHRDNFAAIRLVAAILVLFGHSFPLTGGHGPGYLGSPVSTLAVKVFFVISGYLISESWLRDPQVGRYLLRRALRIFPALIVLCLLTVFVAGPILTNLSLIEYFASGATWRYFSNVILSPVYALPGVFQDNIYPGAVNGSLWTLPVEFAMYLLMPLVLVLPGRRVMSVVMAVVLSAASIWFARVSIPEHPAVFWGTNLVNGLEMAPYFFWGAVYRIWIKPERLSLQVAFAMVLLFPLLATDWPRSEAAALVIIPYLTLALGHATPPAFAWVERRGDWSYGAYLYGFLIQQIVAHYLPTPGNNWLNFLLSVPPVLLLGMLSWRLIEQPALRLKPRAARSSGSRTTPAE